MKVKKKLPAIGTADKSKQKCMILGIKGSEFLIRDDPRIMYGWDYVWMLRKTYKGGNWQWLKSLFSSIVDNYPACELFSMLSGAGSWMTFKPHVPP